MKKAFIMFLGLFLLTGCQTYKINMVINEDKSFTVDATIGQDLNINNSDGINNTFDSDLTIKTKLESSGFTVTDYTDTSDNKNIVGYKYKKTYDNIDNYSELTPTPFDWVTAISNEDEKIIPDTKMFTKDNDKYIASYTYDLTNYSEEMVESYEGTYNLSYKVTLPYKSMSNNADEISEDGKTLTWKPKIGSLNEIKYEFQFTESNVIQDNKKSTIDFIKNNFLGIAIGLVIFIIISSIIISVGRIKKMNN